MQCFFTLWDHPQTNSQSIRYNTIKINKSSILGYDFDILESTQSYIHNLAENMGINVCEAWATPARTYQVSTFKYASL